MRQNRLMTATVLPCSQSVASLGGVVSVSAGIPASLASKRVPPPSRFVEPRDLSLASNRRVVEACRGRLALLPLAKHPALRFDPWMEGYRGYLFGARTGPSVSVSALFHELGHAAQFGPESFRTRATEAGYHFKQRRITIGSEVCIDPRTNQSTLRELETYAFQLHLMRAAGFKIRDADFVEYSGMLMKYMTDWYFVPGADEEERARWCAERILEQHWRTTAGDVVDRLEAWLDGTAKRWKRKSWTPAEMGGYGVAV